MRFPSRRIEFQDRHRFADEESCGRHLREVRGPGGFECPRCGAQGSDFIRTRRLEPCLHGRTQASVTAGTIFPRTRKPLRVGFLAVFFRARPKKGISALGSRTEGKLRGLVEGDESYGGGKEPGLGGG